MSVNGSLRRTGSDQHLSDPAKAVGKSSRQRPAVGIALFSLRQSRLRLHRVRRLSTLSGRPSLAAGDGIFAPRADPSCPVAREIALLRNKNQTFFPSETLSQLRIQSKEGFPPLAKRD